jgi:phosphohistidine phosphatase SixA
VRLLVVRHASAGNRARWKGDDRLRPLDRRGRRQAEGLVSLLEQFPLARLLSSPYVRCVQTLEPLAAARGLAIEARDELAEGVAAGAVQRLVAELDGPAALSVHGDLLEELLGRDGPRKKGSVWIFDAGDGGLRPALYLAPPA